MRTMQLLHDNANVFALLPSLAADLLRREPYVESIRRTVDKEAARLQSAGDLLAVQRLHSIRAQLLLLAGPTVLTVDKNKTLLLAYAFGDIYLPALALATSNGVRFEVFRDTTVEEIDAHLTQRPSTEPILIRVLDEPKVKPTAEHVDVNVYLQIRTMLAKVGCTLNLETFEVEHTERSIDPAPQHEDAKEEYADSKEEYVDLYSWYCSCGHFLDQISTVHTKQGPELVVGVEPNIVTNYLQHSQCKHISPLPMCRHLLAVLLVVFNRAALGDEAIRIYCWQPPGPPVGPDGHSPDGPDGAVG